MVEHLAYEYKHKAYFASNREDMLNFVPSDVSKLLDVGCACGEFGKLLKSQRQIEVWGIEAHAAAYEAACAKLDKVINLDIQSADLSLPATYFDCIVFNDVLEHLVDPWGVLVRLRENLKPGGYVVASIPNIRYFDVLKKLLFKGDWSYVDEGVLDRTHLRFFTKKTILDMFASCGYRVLSIDGINGQRFSWKLGSVNFLVRNYIDDMRYKQFACVACIEK